MSEHYVVITVEHHDATYMAGVPAEWDEHDFTSLGCWCKPTLVLAQVVSNAPAADD